MAVPSDGGCVACFLSVVSGVRLQPAWRFLFIDTPNMVVHEGGHVLIWLVRSDVGALGRNDSAAARAASAGELFLPPAAAGGFVFCLFFFFENWIYTATYMADASDGIAAGHAR